MKKSKLNLNELDVPGKLVLADTIDGKLTDNVNFAGSEELLTELRGNASATRRAYEESRLGGLDRMLALRTSEKRLDLNLNQISLFVSSRAAGDADKILSAGLMPSLQTTPMRGKQVYQVAAGPHPGTALLVTPKMAINTVRIWEECTDEVPGATSVWKVVAETTLSKVVVNSHKRGDIVWYRYQTISRDGRSEYSDPVSVMIL